MSSDAESLQASGGLGTEPKTFSPADLTKEPVFTSEIVSPATPASAGTSGKKLGMLLAALGVLAVAAAVGYFFVWPLVTKEEPQETVVTTPTSTLPTPSPAPTPPPAPPSGHQSYFVKPTSGSKQIALSSLTLTQLAGALKATSTDATSTGVLREIVLTVDNKNATSASLVSIIFPGSGLEAYLESDATIFAYYMNGRTYPGYIFKLKSGADLKVAQAAAAKIEQSANLTALYPESPGAPKGSWKSGSVSGVSTRYQAYSSAGASLNYGWVNNNYLVLSTSFDGFKKAVELLK